MRFFSECTHLCTACSCFERMCLAGHGDNDFQPAKEEQLRSMLETGLSPIRKRELHPYEITLIKDILKEYYNG